MKSRFLVCVAAAIALISGFGQFVVAQEVTPQDAIPLVENLNPQEQAAPDPEAKPQEKQEPQNKTKQQPDSSPQGDVEKDKAGKEKSDNQLGDKKPDSGNDDSADQEKSQTDEMEDSESDDEPSDEDSSNDEAGKQGSELARNIFGRESERTDKFSKHSKDFVSVFEPLVGSAETSTVKIMSGRRQLALGVVVDQAGFILTKASELKGDLTCKFPDGRQATAEVFGIDPTTDLAMLQVHIDNVNVIQWGQGPPPKVGQWLATPNGKTTKLEVGVVGVDLRKIPPSRPFIGITMINAEGKDGVQIMTRVPRSPAEEAELLVGDIITHLDEIAIKDREALQETLGQYDVNDRVTLTILRGSDVKKIKLTLADSDKTSPVFDRSNQQNSMGSVLSRRRKDFPNAFQHDSMLGSNLCGGPIVDSSGQVVGINIARAGRVASLSLPVEIILPVVAMLKTGEYSPENVNKKEIEVIDAELAELKSKLGHLPDKKNSLETKFQVEKAKQEELEKVLADVQDRLKVIELKSKSFGTELDTVTRELKNAEKVQQRLEADRKQLATGIR